ncbi:MAG: arsenate reductase (glutaredoxin) [Parashewanella sp.]
MTKVTIFHNPRCSKSRQTLALLKDNQCDITVVEYLKDIPSIDTLSSILSMLNISPRELMRTKEAEYKELQLNNENLSDAELLQAMVTTPKLIERPIVIADNRAVIGRPPENVFTII